MTHMRQVLADMPSDEKTQTQVEQQTQIPKMTQHTTTERKIAASARSRMPIQKNEFSWLSIGYDIAMMLLICFDLLLLAIDGILMSTFGNTVSGWLGLDISAYRAGVQIFAWNHATVALIGGAITIFLVVELVVRWALAIITKRYYRWFFFPFVHWYEVLSVFPQLRALRLLRVVVIGYGFYKMGWRFLPESWIRTAKFYYDVVLEEVSDRVILTALDSVERELRESGAHHALVKNIINNHRDQIEAVAGEIMQQEVAPALRTHAQLTREGVGNAVYRALANVPDLNKYLRLIPIAGGIIESQIQQVGRQVAENITDELVKPFAEAPPKGQVFNNNFSLIAKRVGEISAEHEPLEDLVSSIVFSSFETIRAQIAVQQWKERANDD